MVLELYLGVDGFDQTSAMIVFCRFCIKELCSQGNPSVGCIVSLITLSQKEKFTFQYTLDFLNYLCEMEILIVLC